MNWGVEIQTYQTEGPENGQSLNIGQSQLHQTECDNDTVKNVPAHLEVIVGVHSNELEHHFSCEDSSKYLEK